MQLQRLHSMFGIVLFLLLVIGNGVLSCTQDQTDIKPVVEATSDSLSVVFARDTSEIPNDAFGEQVRYGRALILNTAVYLGPNGKVGKYLGNYMNCTNCHLEAGTRPYGLNFLSTHGRYPQFRPRENRILSLAERVNNCIERPHNGRPLPLDAPEMLAIISYIKWLGEGIPVNTHVEGDKSSVIQLPDYPLNKKHGKQVYQLECARCHGENGEGKWNEDSTTYTYPPLWGMQSYQAGSSLFRIIKAAQFIKANMPYDQVTWRNMKLTDREALDVAAYINSEEHLRPANKGKDYPDVGKKPIDYPYGPFNDTFSEKQHKYGPFKPIMEYRKQKGLFVHY